MIIIGIDPGYEDLGIGIIETDPMPTFVYANTFTYLREEYLPGFEQPRPFKTLSKKKKELIRSQGGVKTFSTGERLMKAEKSLQDVLAQYKPDVAAIEIPRFPCKNDVADLVHYVVGVIVKNLTAWSLPTYNYAPKFVKLQIGGSGNSDKKGVQEGVLTYFDIPNLEARQPDEIDALAIALTHYEKTKTSEVKYA